MEGKMVDNEKTNPRHFTSRLYAFSGLASLLTALLFLMGGFLMIEYLLNVDTIEGGLELIGGNWLVVIFQVLSGVDSQAMAKLSLVNLLDISLLSLSGLSLLGLYFSMKKTSRVWSLVALVLPFLGIVIFLFTKTAGRSAFMAAILVISLVMLKSKLFNKTVPIIGLAAGILLFIGDFTASGPHPGTIIVLFSLGYLLAIVWFLLIARRLIQFALIGNPSDL
jgi:hypothetical protein